MTQQTDVSIEMKVAHMEAELLRGESAFAHRHNNGEWFITHRNNEELPARNHRDPDKQWWFCEQLKIVPFPTGVDWECYDYLEMGGGRSVPRTISRHESRSRAIQLAIEAEAERRWKESEG